MKTLAVIGASGHGKVVADTALQLDYEKVVFFDDAWPEKISVGMWEIIGNTDDLVSSYDQYDGILVAIGNNKIRMDKQSLLSCRDVELTDLVHPGAVVSDYSSIGEGSVIFAGAVVNVDVVLGRAVIINTGATVDHDCQLDDGVHIAPGAHLSGDVHVGACSWIGVGACVRQGIRIGANVMVGAGAVVVSDIPDGVTVVGNPARAGSSDYSSL